MTALAGAHVVVTGGSEGIGIATAIEASARGAKVSLIARRRDVLDAATTGIGGPVAVASADVTDPDATSAAIASVESELGPCDVLVCCAGFAKPGYFEDLTPDDFRRHMDVNYLGTVHAVRAVLPAMRSRRAGHVVVTASTAGLIGVFGYGAYSPTKFAVRGLAETLRSEVRADGVRVAVVYPPDTATPGFEQENLTKPPETAALSGAIAPITAEAMASRIVDGIERDRLDIFADRTTATLARFGGVLAPAVRWHTDRVIRRAGRSDRRA